MSGHVLLSILAMLCPWLSTTTLESPMPRLEEVRTVTKTLTGGDTLTGGVAGFIQLELPQPRVEQRFDVASTTFTFRPTIAGVPNRLHVIGPKLTIYINGLPYNMPVPLADYGTGPTLTWALNPSDGEEPPALATVNYGSPYTLLARDTVTASLEGNFAGGDGSANFNFQLQMTARMSGERNP